VCPIFDASGQVMAAACTASPAGAGAPRAPDALRVRLDEEAPLPVRLTAEAQLQQVADALPVLVSYVDAEERYRFNNRAYEEWFGMPAEALRGRTVREVVGEEAYAGLSPYIATALAGESVSFTEEVPYAFGDRRLVHARYISDCDPDGRVRGFFAVVADVRAPPATPTPEHAAHVVPHRPLTPGLAALGGMTGEILHEITQPITAIATYTEASIRLLRHADAPLPGEILDWLEDMRGQARRASEIIHRFRAFVRGGQLRRTLMDVNAMITHCARAVRPDAAAAGVGLELALARHPCRISADRVLLEQALRNLVTNALEALSASQAQQRTLTIRTSRDRGVVEVEVRDNGPGVPEDVHERVFEPFFSTKAEGVGIGLAITRSIIDAHGGALTLSPTPGGGATFRFRLPLVHRDVDDHERSE
jgi:PAS domain S-box-containing protein